MFRSRATRYAAHAANLFQKRNAGGPRDPRNPNLPGMDGYVNYVFREDGQLGAAVFVLWCFIAKLIVIYYPYPIYLPAVMPAPGEIIPKLREERFWDWVILEDDNFEKFLNNNV